MAYLSVTRELALIDTAANKFSRCVRAQAHTHASVTEVTVLLIGFLDVDFQ